MPYTVNTHVARHGYAENLDFYFSMSRFKRSHDSQSHPYKETIMSHLVATLIYLSQNYSYHIRGVGSFLIPNFNFIKHIDMYFHNPEKSNKKVEYFNIDDL